MQKNANTICGDKNEENSSNLHFLCLDSRQYSFWLEPDSDPKG